MIVKNLFKLFVVAVMITGCSVKSANKLDSDNISSIDENSLLTDIHFDYDSYELDNSAKTTAKSNAEILLKSDVSTKIQIEGHTDERGTSEYNMALGAKRARAALEALRSHGVESSRMSTVSYGEDVPVDPAHTESAWAKNRRAHIKIQK